MMMQLKVFILILIHISFQCCQGQNIEGKQNNTSDITLSISPNIDTTDQFNKQILSELKLFLQTKNDLKNSKIDWRDSYSGQFRMTIQSLYKIEESPRYGTGYYQPSLMEIIPTDQENTRIIKLAFIGHHEATKENIVKAIFNFLAEEINDQIFFKDIIRYNCRDWQRIRTQHIEYVISPKRKANSVQIQEQELNNLKLADYFNTEIINFTYYSCTNSVELFQVLGYDYQPMMYPPISGGRAYPKDGFLISGRNSEIYNHEVVHLYTSNLFPSKNQLLDEGLATIIGGSGDYEYNWHRQKLQAYIKDHRVSFLENSRKVFAKKYINDVTSIPYMTGALICEYILDNYGKQKLFEIFSTNGSDLFELLSQVGINEDNLEEYLHAQLQKEAPTPLF